MTTPTGRSQMYVLLTVIALVAIVAVGWVTLAGAHGSPAENGGTMQTTMPAGADDDGGVGYDGPSGIWVNGTGKAGAPPDIAMISLGVEAIEDTAAEARSKAAAAMSGVMSVLINAGVSIDDIRTSYFNISPRYQSVEVERCDEADDSKQSSGSSTVVEEQTCYTAWESRLIGYSVTNQATVKIRSLRNAGTIIDKATESAGDLVRINGISFDIEDRQPLQDEARASAVADLKRKAAMLAELSGVRLGRLVYINEGSAYVEPPQPLYARAEAAMADFAGAATSISGGKLEVSTTLQGVFLIDGEVTPEPTATAVPAPTTEPATATPRKTPAATKASN